MGVTSAVGLYVAVKLGQHWGELRTIARNAVSSVSAFVDDHVIVPSKYARVC